MAAPTSLAEEVDARIVSAVERLNAIGIALSRERDPDRLLEMILHGAMDLTESDGGTLYTVGDGGESLAFAIMRTRSLGIELGGTTGRAIDLPPVRLRDSAGRPNHASVVAHAVLDRSTVNIADAYRAEGFDFSGTRAFDARTGYRSTSMLTVPLHDHQEEIIGVLQLLNAADGRGGVQPFSPAQQRFVESLASQAAVTMTNRALIGEVSRLFESFIEVIATAIDEKSPYTGGHCRRVPELTMRLVEAAHASEVGELAGFTIDDDDRYELKIASWLHDCGKITTPEWVMDKATKLERIHDRIEEVAARFSTLRQAAETDHWRRLAEGADEAGSSALRDRQLAQLADDLAFLRRANTGGEFMRAGDQERVRRVAAQTWLDADGGQRPLLSAQEVDNLCIPRGTLLPEERKIINHHIVATIRMLESLPFPKHLANVPEIAGGHHEKMDGTGYPRGLRRAEMSVQARAMGIADVFEALTASDRPYKQPMPLSRALAILRRMRDDGHVDPDLFEVFVRSRVWEEYAREFLADEQVDEVDVEALLAD